MAETSLSAPASERDSRNRACDVIIIGAGLGGSAVAALLGRRNIRALLVDRHETYPADFRAEKLDHDQIELIDQLGLLPPVKTCATEIRRVINVRNGRVIDRTDALHYSLAYDELVAALRSVIPPSVERLTGRVEAMQTSADWQQVRVGGQMISARLVVLATGLGPGLSKELGLERVVHMKGCTVSIGFDVEPAPGDKFHFPALTCYGQDPSDRIDYLTLFPMRDRMRANLFSFHDYRDEWTAAFRSDPQATLLAAMPGLERFLGQFSIRGPVIVRPNDLYEITNHRQPGVVAIGDAFQTSCPAAGTGVTRVLNDVRWLCEVHVPNWLATPGMPVEKICQFYDDARKRACDTSSLQTARFRRALTTDLSLPWRIERQVRFSLRPIRQWARDAITRRSRRDAAAATAQAAEHR